MNRKFNFSGAHALSRNLNGCGAARPSKFYQLTPAGNKTAGADPAPFPSLYCSGQSPHRICIATTTSCTLEWRSDGHVRVSAMGGAAFRND